MRHARSALNYRVGKIRHRGRFPYEGRKNPHMENNPSACGKREQEENLPFFLFFRIRLFCCAALFAAFAFYSRQTAGEQEAGESTATVFQLISEDADSEQWQSLLEPASIRREAMDFLGMD